MFFPLLVPEELHCKFFIYIKQDCCQHWPENSDARRILNTFAWRPKMNFFFFFFGLRNCIHQDVSDVQYSWGKCTASNILVSYHSWRPSQATSHHPPKMPGWRGMSCSVDRPGWPAAWLGVVNFCPTAAPSLAAWDDLSDTKQEALNK